jgi:hypothetical protein
LLTNFPATILNTIQWVLPKPAEQRDMGNALTKAHHAHSYQAQSATQEGKVKQKHNGKSNAHSSARNFVYGLFNIVYMSGYVL